MNNWIIQFVAIGGLLFVTATTVFASVAPSSAPATDSNKVKYRSGETVNFEELLIQGQLKRPEVAVVTGNTQQGADGLLRLRENFLDRVATDAGEEP